ncbi:MAG: hypothetical protein AAGD10_21630 [Myxococcota bacterium]
MLIATLALSAAAGQCFNTMPYLSLYDSSASNLVEEFERAGFGPQNNRDKIYGTGTAYFPTSGGQFSWSSDAEANALLFCKKAFPSLGYECVDGVQEQTFLPPREYNGPTSPHYLAKHWTPGNDFFQPAETEDGQPGPFPALVGFSCGFLTPKPAPVPPGPIFVSGRSSTGGSGSNSSRGVISPPPGGGGGPTPPPANGIDLTIKASPGAVEWGTSEQFTVTVTPQPGFPAGTTVDVFASAVNGAGVVVDPISQPVVINSAPVDLTFNLEPADRDSRLGCIDVEVTANSGTVADIETFGSRVTPIDGGFAKVFDAAVGPDNFVGNLSRTCSTPNLATRPSETVDATASPSGVVQGPVNLVLERNSQGPVQSLEILQYDLLPTSGGLPPAADGCMVAFTQQTDPPPVPLPSNPTVMNWNTFGFAEHVAPTTATNPNGIPSSGVTPRRQSAFEGVAQIWMAPDSTAHLQVGGLNTGGGPFNGLRRAKAFDNITGNESNGKPVCANVLSVRREGDDIIVESQNLATPPEGCLPVTFSVTPPGGTDCQ